jgi:hypothetical protein
MKDLIIIGAHCPDEERKKLLYNLVNSFQKIRESFDILITTHLPIPEYITEQVDYVFFDKNNELIYDLNYINQPWFSPNSGQHIYSTYVSGYSTYLAVYRLLIGGLGLAKTMGYTKTHYIEYDISINDFSELQDNNILLENYNSIQYQKESKDYETNLGWGIGNFISMRVDKLDNIFLEYNKDKLLSLIKNNFSKTNEKYTQEILDLNPPRLVKDYQILIDKNIKVNLSSTSEKDKLDFWTVPYYDSKTDTINFVGWNQKSKIPIDISVLINNKEFISFTKVKHFNYYIRELGKLKDIDNILILVNNQIKTHIDFDKISKEDFIKTNFIKYD